MSFEERLCYILKYPRSILISETQVQRTLEVRCTCGKDKP